MERQELLIRLSKEIDLLEKKGQFKKANILHKNFIKLADSNDSNAEILQALMEAVVNPKKQNDSKKHQSVISPKSENTLVNTDSESSSEESSQKGKGLSQVNPMLLPLFENRASREIAEKTTKEVAEKATEEAGKKGVGKALIKSLTPKQIGRIGLWTAIVDMGVDYAVDVFEDAQGPYQMYKNHMPDIKRIMSKINELSDNNDIRTLTNNLNLLLQQVGKELEIAKKQLKVANVVNRRNVYNFKQDNTKLAIRGEFESETPKYLRDLIQGGAIGAGVGALVGGGVGAIPGAILGAGGKLLGRGAEDIWYSSISDTGKAYFQGKDLEQKITRLANTFEELNPQLSEAMKVLADQILNKLEDLNISNPRKSYLENVIRHLEKKTLKPIGLSK